MFQNPALRACPNHEREVDAVLFREFTDGWRRLYLRRVDKREGPAPDYTPTTSVNTFLVCGLPTSDFGVGAAFALMFAFGYAVNAT